MTIPKRNQDSTAVGALRDYNIHIRVNRFASKRLASIQGLCASHGKCETLGYLFENVALPAIIAYANKYAQKAARKRQEARA